MTRYGLIVLAGVLSGAPAPLGAQVVLYVDQDAPPGGDGFSWETTFEQATFEGLGDLPGGTFQSIGYGVSADGNVVVGESESQWGPEAFRWQDGVMFSLGDLPGGPFNSQANAVSADGSIVVGAGLTSTKTEPQVSDAVVWYPTFMMSLGHHMRAEDVSAAGTEVAGYGASPNTDTEAFRWEDDAITWLGDLPGGAYHSEAAAISSDGTVVVGTGHVLAGSEPFRWEGGKMVGLGHVPSATTSSGYGVSDDGSVVVGGSHTDHGQEAFRWSDGVMTALGTFPDTTTVEANARDASADGTVIVGRDIDAAFIWDEINGMRRISDVLVADYGVDLTGWTLEDAYGISADGRTIVGYGTNTNGDQEAWIAKLPPCDEETPSVVHGNGRPSETRPFSGYTDPRAESTTGENPDLGINEVFIRFSEPVRAVGGGPLVPQSFIVSSTGGEAPKIADVDMTKNPLIKVTLASPPPLMEWTTITAVVEDMCGDAIESLGDLGPGIEEPDRIDFLFLPCDVDQNGQVGPFDLLRFRQIVNGIYVPTHGTLEDYADTNRTGEITPFDLLMYRQLINGTIPATRPWAGETANHAQP